MAEHIQKVQDRAYVTLDAARRLTPTVLGIGLVEGMHMSVPVAGA